MSIQATPPTSPPAPALPRLDPEAYEPIPGTISFGEFLAALNPLHHLPVVGTIYRAVTGETIQPALRVLGGGLLGGPIGALSAAVMAAIDEFRSPANRALAEASRRDPPHATG